MKLECPKCRKRVPLNSHVAEDLKYPYFKCAICSRVIYSEIMQSVADNWSIDRIRVVGYEKFTEEVLVN